MGNFKNKRIQLLSGACLNIGILFMGTMAGWTSVVIPKLQDLKQTPLSHTITLSQGSWVGSLFTLGFLCGPFIAGSVSNRFGRKICAVLGAFIISVGSILLLLANIFEMLLVGRFICGLGTGILNVNSIIYFGEVASVNIRGILLASMGVAYSFGVLLINIVGLASYNSIGYTGLVLSLMHFVSCFYIEESPIFYLIKGKEDKIMEVLERLGRKNEILGITYMNEYSSLNKKQDWKWQEIFKIKCNRKSFLIGLPLIIFNLCSGILTASFFTVSIFQLAGSSIKPAIASIITSATMLFGSLIAPTFIETKGRRILMMTSSLGCSFSFAILGTYFYLQNIGSHLIESLTWLPLVSLMYSFISHSIGLNVIPSTILGELFLPNVRSIGCSIVKILASLVLFVSISSFGYIVEHFGSFIVFWMFAIINALAFLFTLMVVPETKGLTLAEIQLILSE